MSMPAKKPAPFDLDAFLADDIAAAEKKVKYREVTLFKRTWKVTTEPNVYLAVASANGDAAAITQLLINVFHPDEREDFRRAIGQADGIDAEVLLKMLNALVEEATEHPTKSPSGSSRASAASKPA